MRKIIIISLLILSIFTISCSEQVTVETVTTPETITITKIVEVENTDRIEELEADNLSLKAEIEKYDKLISGLNDLLGNVYYGYASNKNWKADGFTAFSIEYKEKYYLITAGHCVHYKYGDIDTGVYTNFKFKANFDNEWIYPKLLVYENDFRYGKDYAIFTCDKIDSGLKTGEYELPAFILGAGKLNIIKGNTSTNIDSESGSPIININGEVIGIMTGGSTNINYVLQAIDNLK